MSRQRRAWVINLDAENELETAGSYTPSLRMRSIVTYNREQLVGSLVAKGDVVLGHEESPTDSAARGLPGFAWCPTPSALARLAAAGAIPIGAPPVEVLAEVNARPFATAVRAPLVEDSFEKRTALTFEEVLELLARPTPYGWLVRRFFGAAGRGRRRVRAGIPDNAERAWIASSLRKGPLTIEPWVRVTREYTRSAWVESTGEVVIAPPCFQETTPQGAWTRTETAASGEVLDEDDARLAEMIEMVGSALAEAGYFGPFGIDAFRHNVPGRSGSRDVLNPLSEINARFTMDWALGMAERTESLLARPRLDD